MHWVFSDAAVGVRGGCGEGGGEMNCHNTNSILRTKYTKTMKPNILVSGQLYIHRTTIMGMTLFLDNYPLGKLPTSMFTPVGE